MKMPWDDKNGMAKATVILALLFIVSAGLCGINFAAVTSIKRPTNWLTTGLIITAYIELAGMIVSIIGLIVILVTAVSKYLIDLVRRGSEDAE